MKNPWRYCETDPPDQYIRCEIKGRNCKRYVGYRCGTKYYETIGNYVIKDPYLWRYIPQGSYLWETIEQKIYSLIYGGEKETIYADIKE